MHPIAIALVCIAIATVSLWGWGWLVQRSMRVPPLAWPVTAGLGLATVILVGGGLNLARQARPAAFDAIVAAGIVFALIGAVPALRQTRCWPPPGVILASLPLLVAGGCVVLFLLPPSAYNLHDDFEKYFALPVKMLATGTLAPDPFSSLGAETLGGQAFLQAFVVAHFPIAYISTVDGLFCLLLCMAIVAFGRSPGRWGVGAATAGVCVCSIDPQVVNISSVFSGAALVAAAVLMSGWVAAHGNQVRSAMLLGLVYAGLIALKTTFGVFVGVHLLCLLLAGWWFGDWRWTSTLWAGAGTVAGLAPWLLLHLPLYLAPAQPPTIIPPGVREEIGLFSRVPGYGVAPLPYTLLAIAVLAGGIFFALASRRRREPGSSPSSSACATGFAAGLTYFLFMVVGGPLMFGRFGATRYACPVLIGAVPTMIRLLESRETKRPFVLHLGLAGFALAVGGLFWPSTVQRLHQWWRDRTPLAFFTFVQPTGRQDLITHTRYVLGGDVRANLAGIQWLVPAGEPMGAWVNAPFLLDFHRNPVLNADPAGLSMRWANWPAGMRYFLLEYQGFAIRPDAEYRALLNSPVQVDRLSATCARAFLNELHRRAESAAIIYNDGAYLLMRTDALTSTAHESVGQSSGSP